MTRSTVSLFSHDSCAMIWEANRSIDGFCMSFWVAEEHMVRGSNCRSIWKLGEICQDLGWRPGLCCKLFDAGCATFLLLLLLLFSSHSFVNVTFDQPMYVLSYLLFSCFFYPASDRLSYFVFFLVFALLSLLVLRLYISIRYRYRLYGGAVTP